MSGHSELSGKLSILLSHGSEAVPPCDTGIDIVAPEKRRVMAHRENSTRQR